MDVEAIVVGGSYAGLSAALQLARARRDVVVVDANLRRNRFSGSAHGFIGHDGEDPAAIVAAARRQLLAYPNVRWLDDTARFVDREGERSTVIEAGGERLRTRCLVLATGVVDELPAIDGLFERWGTSVFHCPYCHGYELERGRIGILASGPMSLHQALLLPDWGTVTLFLDGRLALDRAQVDALGRRGVTIEPSRVVRIGERATVHLDDGRRIAFEGLFTVTTTRMASPLAEQAGCTFDGGPAGPFVRRDDGLATTVAGVFACGDAARPFGSVAIAVGDGAATGASAHRSLITALASA